MQISVRCSVAVHCLVFVHEAAGGVRVTSTLLAQSTGCNPVTIRSIMSALKKAGLVSAPRGGTGGATLARDPADVTLYDVYHAVDPGGLDELIRVHDCAGRACPVARNIASVLEAPYRQIADAARDAMRQVTLEQLIERYHRELAAEGPVPA